MLNASKFRELATTVIGALALTTAVASALDLTMAPTGNDSWSGQRSRPNATHTDGPLASLTGARNRIRELRAKGTLTEPVRVLVADGLYTVTSALELTPEDSGTMQSPITYEAARGAHPIFSGGRKILGWQPGAEGLWPGGSTPRSPRSPARAA